MKLINHRPDEFLAAINRDMAAEQLREMRMQNTQRSILCYTSLAITVFSVIAVVVIVVLMGCGVIMLPEKVILALILAIVAGGRAMFLSIIKSLFSRGE